MSEEPTTGETVQITEIQAWEFQLDGSFVPKTFQTDVQLLKEPSKNTVKKEALYLYGLSEVGFERILSLGLSYNNIRTMIFKNESGEMAVSLCDTELIYCANFPILLEFFRRYGEFLQLALQSQTNDCLYNLCALLKDQKKNKPS